MAKTGNPSLLYSLASQTYFAHAEKRGGGKIRLVYFGQVFVCTAGMLAVPIRLQYLRRRFRDPSAVLSTKLGSTLIRKPIATVSLHRKRTSRRQRANLHRLVNGNVYGSRILIATPTSLSHVRATR